LKTSEVGSFSAGGWVHLISGVTKTTEEAVLSIFMSPEETLLRSCFYKKNIAAVLKACIPYHPETCPRLLAFLPALRETIVLRT